MFKVYELDGNGNEVLVTEIRKETIRNKELRELPSQLKKKNLIVVDVSTHRRTYVETSENGDVNVY